MESLLAYVVADPRRLLAAAVVLVVLVGAVARSRGSAGPVQKDAQRLFTADQCRRIHERAQNQCEHNPWLGGRCSAAGTQADHVYPHAKGGATSLANAQSLCARHNRAKSARVPSPFYIWRLEHRRRSYFPDGERAKVNWHQPSQLG
ncbi:HNH endonuclease [Pseudactinotalea sp. HY160]|uniref:HNH endonuclease n=1 Tax=Pseudactinotalea sp. HY160 TaxID=2654490 RepID=UPI00128BFA8B|nr:HNH endonuclease [Pseudactinotalea sp. HY160]MPV50056.1 HNH endonuclease [Pseudactinotalea sp. HY160]